MKRKNDNDLGLCRCCESRDICTRDCDFIIFAIHGKEGLKQRYASKKSYPKTFQELQ